MNYYDFASAMRQLNKDDPRRQEIIRQYPHYAEHLRNMSIKKLAEIRARKVDKEPA